MLDIRPTRLRILKLIALLFTSMHLFACLFWKVAKLRTPEASLILYLNLQLTGIAGKPQCEAD